MVHAETPFYLKDVPLVQRALTGKTRYKKKKPDTDLGYRTEWDDMVGEMCEYDGISLLKNENQVMLCQDAVREHSFARLSCHQKQRRVHVETNSTPER